LEPSCLAICVDFLPSPLAAEKTFFPKDLFAIITKLKKIGKTV
jgi:hypothetical protein